MFLFTVKYVGQLSAVNYSRKKTIVSIICEVGFDNGHGMGASCCN